MPPKEKKKTMWDNLADRIGDFAEENLWEGDEQYFKDKYGDDWESKYESSRQDVRSLYGLIPQTSGDLKKDAVMYALTLLIGKPAGKQLFRGVTQPTKTMIQGGKLKGGAKHTGSIYTQESPLITSGYAEGMKAGKMAERHVAGAGYADDIFFNQPVGGRGDIIEFDFPRSWMDRHARGGSMWQQYGRFEGSGGRLIPGAREVEFLRDIPEEYIMNITPAREIIRSKLPELGRY
jgi:hypothetical protein